MSHHQGVNHPTSDHRANESDAPQAAPSSRHRTPVNDRLSLTDDEWRQHPDFKPMQTALAWLVRIAPQRGRNFAPFIYRSPDGTHDVPNPTLLDNFVRKTAWPLDERRQRHDFLPRYDGVLLRAVPRALLKGALDNLIPLHQAFCQRWSEARPLVEASPAAPETKDAIARAASAGETLGRHADAWCNAITGRVGAIQQQLTLESEAHALATHLSPGQWARHCAQLLQRSVPGSSQCALVARLIAEPTAEQAATCTPAFVQTCLLHGDAGIRNAAVYGLVARTTSTPSESTRATHRRSSLSRR